MKKRIGSRLPVVRGSLLGRFVTLAVCLLFVCGLACPDSLASGERQRRSSRAVARKGVVKKGVTRKQARARRGGRRKKDAGPPLVARLRVPVPPASAT
jgi:hypothetical protein